MARLRTARQADARAIARVHVEAWRSTYAGMLPDGYLAGLSVESHARRWKRMLTPHGDTAVVVEDAEAGVVGFGSAGPSRESGRPAADWSGEVYTLYLLTDWQGRGLGRALLHALFDRLRERDLDRVLLWVVAANPTRFFYEAMGGRVVARRCEPFAGIMLDELAYGWDLACDDARRVA
jgi:L-amino acid N-acyltransferase YncA